MPLSPQDIVALSRLLDEALELDASQREAWLNNMPAAGRHLVPQLREVLAARDSTGASDFLAALPALDATNDHDDDTAHAGESVGPYRLIREIGRGGMGTVWLAERADGAFKRQVALKLPRLAWGAGLAKRMARERDICAMLEHPNIARLYDAGVDERGRPFIALEYIDGVAIDAWCQQRQLPLRDRLRLVVQVAKAVAYAHGRLVVHRDLKPSNVLVSEDGQVHLLDFGIAKLLDDAQQDHAATQEQVRVLTPHYASPEQLKGETLTVQSDVYSLGVLAYELLTGHLPYDARRKTPAAIEEAILQGNLVAPSQRVEDSALARQLKGDIDAIVGKAMNIAQGQRYPTADALAADIERHLAGETVTARPDSRGYRLRKTLKRHWIGVSASAAVLVSVLTGAGIAVVQAQRAVKAAEKERAVKEFVADVFRINVKEPTAPGELRSAPTGAFLEHSAKLVKARFDGQPAMQAELYAIVGKAFEDMGAFRLASEYGARRVSALDAAKANRFEQARAVLQLARSRLGERQIERAQSDAQRAATLAEGDPSIVLSALVVVANAHAIAGQLDLASTVLDQIDAQLVAQNLQDGVTAAHATRVRGNVLGRQNRRPEAMRLYDAAIAMAIQAEGADSTVAADARLDAAWELATTSDAAGASRYFDAGVQAVRRRGYDHLIGAALDTARFATNRFRQASQISFDEARTEVARARAEVAATGRVIPSEIAAEFDFLEGSTLSGWGMIEAARPLLARSVPTLFEAASTPVRRWRLSATFGSQLMEEGSHERADHWLRERLRARVERGEGQHPFAAGDHHAIANNLRMWGRQEQAAASLTRAPTFPAITIEKDASPDRYNLLLKLLTTEIALDLERTADAMTSFPHALLNPTGVASPRRDDFAARFVLGRILCANAQAREGTSQLREVVERNSGNTYEHAPQLAYQRAVAGLCAFKAGDRKSAETWAQQARESFTVQPGVSDFYKAPLLELEAKLAKR